MSHVNVQMTISNPSDERLSETVEALVDTGATFTVVPRTLADQLRLPITGSRSVQTATGPVTLPRSRALCQINGDSEITPVLISDSLNRVLVGVFTLEALALTVDPTTGTVNEAETLLL